MIAAAARFVASLRSQSPFLDHAIVEHIALQIGFALDREQLVNARPRGRRLLARLRA